MKKNLSGILILILLFIISGCSETKYVKSKKKIVLPKTYSEHFYNDLRYGLFIPENYNPAQKYPLVVYLHGSTDTVSWDLSWYDESFQSKNPSFILTPKSMEKSNGWGNSWDENHSPDAKKTLEVIANIKKEYSIDADRLYVYGASMGGFGTFSFLAKEPEMFAAAFSICGGGDPATAEKIINTPLWIFHGDSDKVVQVDLSRNMFKALVNKGSKKVRYIEYPGVGHASWTPAWKEPAIKEWLVSHVKNIEHGTPDTPEKLSLTLSENSMSQLNWSAPSDTVNPNNKIWYYKLYRNENEVAELNHLTDTYVDSSGIKAEAYSFSAVNYFFKESKRVYAK